MEQENIGWKIIKGQREEMGDVKTFAVIGNGIISKRHREAIRHIGGEVVLLYDPYMDLSDLSLLEEDGGGLNFHFNEIDSFIRAVLIKRPDFFVICSPTNTHREYIQLALKLGIHVICEKPMCLPWEPLIDDDRINIVLQLRWLPNLPEKANLIKAVMWRNEEFFQTWKGDPRLAGGNIYEFFIHYIDLAIQLGADFEGVVNLGNGEQERKIFYDLSNGYQAAIDLMGIDMQTLYDRMYQDILVGKGVKPKDIFYLTWILQRLSDIHGYRFGGINQPIKILKEFLNGNF